MIREVGYQSAFTFIYSRRTGTPAASMEDQVDPSVVAGRMKRLIDLVQEFASRAADRDTGKTMPVLVEEVNSQDPGMVSGRLSGNLMVHFPGDASLIGEIVDVELTESRGFYYIGKRSGDGASAGTGGI